MPYLALARKYRPQRFEDIVGQEHVSQTLQKAIDANRVHHAYLFTGIRGVGKTTAARVLAKALNCEKGPTNEPCNECIACTEITAGRSMDVMELDAASNRGIDDIRELREGVRYTTARDRYKIIIIDEVHMLTEAAFNALLKTLEEPPPHVRFVLATTDPQKLPATILSRCQRFDFRRVTASALVAHLARLCTSEGIAADEAALAIIVRQTQGSVRDALSLLDQLLAASTGDSLTAEQTMEILGVADRKRVFATIRALLEQDAKAALLILREVFVTGYDVTLFINEVLAVLRDAMVMRIAGQNKELVDLAQQELDELETIIADRNPYDLHHYLRVMLDAVEQIRKSEFPMFAAEEALVRVASAGHSAKIPKLIQRLADLEQRLSSRGGDGRKLFKESAPQQQEEPEEPPSNPNESGAEEVPAAPEDLAPAPIADADDDATDEAGPPLLEAVDIPLDEVPPPADTFALKPGAAPPSEDDGDERAAVLPPLPTGPALPGITKGAKKTSRRKIDHELLASMPKTPPKEVAPAPANSKNTEPGELPVTEDQEGVLVHREPPYPDLAAADRSDLWSSFLKFVISKSHDELANFDTRVLEACIVSDATAEKITVTFPAGAAATLKPLRLKETLPAFLAIPIAVELLPSEEKMLDDSMEADRQRRREQRESDIDAELRKHPHVAAALGLFGGQVISTDVDLDALEDQD